MLGSRKNMLKVGLISSLIILLCAMLVQVSGVQSRRVPHDPAGISQLVENRKGQVSCWGVRIQLGKLRFRHNISPNQIIIREAKHGHDLRETMTWSVDENASQLSIRFKPGMGDFGTGNTVEVQIERSAFIGPISSGNNHFRWTMDTDVL
jgi:hypothetical protein